MNKIIFHIFLVFTFASSVASSAAIDLKENFKGREWEFIQYELKIVPNNQQLFRNNSKKSILLLVSSVILPSIVAWLCTCKEREEASIIAGLFGFFGGALVEIGIDNFILKRNEFKALLKFIKDWPENKDYTPLSFHNSFEQLYTLYVHEGETNELKQQIRRFKSVIDHALRNRFPAGYHSFTTRTTLPNAQQPITFYTPLSIQTYNYPVQNMLLK